MNIGKVVSHLDINEIITRANAFEAKGDFAAAVDVIESNLGGLDEASANFAKGVSVYFKTKLSKTAQVASARAQVAMAEQVAKMREILGKFGKNSHLDSIPENALLPAEFNLFDSIIRKNPSILAYQNSQKYLISTLIKTGSGGYTIKELSELFQIMAQRLVDLGVINRQSFVVLNTGHNIPMVKQLMKNAHLGQVSGVNDIGTDSFIGISHKATVLLRALMTGNDSQTRLSPSTLEKLKIELREILNLKLPSCPAQEDAIANYLRECHGSVERCADQNFTYPGTLKSPTTGKGAKYIGVDFHRNQSFDTTLLPTAEQLRTAGMKKVVFLDETVPISTYTPDEGENLYEEMCRGKMDFVRDKLDEVSRLVIKNDDANAKKVIMTIMDTLKPKPLSRKLKPPTQAQIQEAQDLAANGEFGYKHDLASRSDMVDYIKTLTAGKMPVIVEGVDIIKLETFPLHQLKGVTKNAIAINQASHASLDKVARFINKLEDLAVQ